MKIEETTSKTNNTNTQAKQSSEQKKQPQKPDSSKTREKSTFQTILKQAGLGLLFLVIGMLVILLALYLPNANQLKTAQAELDRLSSIETQYLDLQQSYSKTQAQALVYKVMSNASQLKVALIDNDSDRTSQYLGYIEEDLSQLEISDFPNLPSSLLTQFEKVKSTITSDKLTAIEELQEFYNDLLLLADNL